MKDFKHHEHCGEALKREKPTLCGEVDTTGMGEYYSMHKPHPHCGYEIPPFKPLFVPGMSPQEQTQVIAKRVDELTKMLCDYSEKVYGAYEDIVHSAICNDAYYSEIETETGYISATSAKYTVVHIPFIDRAGQPIYLQLGTAYDNTTNSGLHEGVFSCSEKKIADKLIPAFNIADKWTGKARWKGAPIPSESGKFTLGVLRNGFFKIYNQTATDADMNKDDVVNAMGVQGVLVSGGAKATDSYDENTKDKVVGRVGLGMNFSTQERIIILVDGEQAEGVTSGGGCTSDQLAELFVKYGCTVAVETANGATTCMLDKGELVNIPYENMNTRSDSEDKIPYEPAINCYWYITKKRHYHNDYVREVGELMQKYGYAVWKSIVEGKAVDALRDEVKNVWNALNQEIDDREKADQTLQTNIDNLSDHVDEIYSELKEADKALDEKIDRVNDALEKEVQDRTDADTALDTKFTNALNKEISDREDAVSGLDEKYATAVAKEIADRKEADENLDTKFTKAVADEATERENGDSALDDKFTQALADEKTAREEDDTALDTKFTKALETETTARESADTELDNKIATETTNRTNADSTLNEKINTETTERKTADTDITASITQLKNDYESFKTSTNADLATKKEQIDNILADIATVKTNISDLQAAQSQIDNTFTQIMKTLSEMEQSFENLKQTVTNLQASWEQYKTTWEATWTQYKSDIESAFEEFKNAVNASLAAYVPLAGTEEDKFITGMVVAKGTADESNVGFEVGATDSNSDTKVLANKITLDDGTTGYSGIDISSSTDTTNGKVLVVGTGENHDPVYINNVKEPKANLDVANKKYVDANILNCVPLAGTIHGNVTGAIVLEDKPNTTSTHVEVKRKNDEISYSSSTLLLHDGISTTTTYNDVTTTVTLNTSSTSNRARATLRGVYDGNNTDVVLSGVASPVSSTDASNKKYVDDKVAEISVTGDYVPLSGTETDKPITGNINKSIESKTYGGVNYVHNDLYSETAGTNKYHVVDYNKYIPNPSSDNPVSFTDKLVGDAWGSEGVKRVLEYNSESEPAVAEYGVLGVLYKNTLEETGDGYRHVTINPTFLGSDFNGLVLSGGIYKDDGYVHTGLPVSLSGIRTPENNEDAANKQYVDSLFTYTSYTINDMDSSLVGTVLASGNTTAEFSARISNVLSVLPITHSADIEVDYYVVASDYDDDRFDIHFKLRNKGNSDYTIKASDGVRIFRHG